MASTTGTAEDRRALEDEVEVRRLRVERERLALEEEQMQVKRMRLERERANLLHTSSSILRLNVGGQTFDTTHGTLLGSRSTFFERLLDTSGGLVGATRDGDGRLFIDRSPDGFRLVLEWLRGNTNTQTLDRVQRESLLQEAIYYDLPQLTRELHGGYDASVLPADAQQIRAMASAHRDALAEGRDGAAAMADADLVDVFTGTGAERRCALPLGAEGPHRGNFPSHTTALPGCPFLFVGDASRARASRHGNPMPAVRCRDNHEFKVSFEAFAGPLLKGLDMTNLVVAGGAVVEALALRHADANASRATASRSDIDLFVVCADEETARATFARVLEHMRARLAAGGHVGLQPNQLLLMRSCMAVSIYAGSPQRTVQIVLRRYACVAEVIFGFDVDACQLAWDGEKVYATPSAERAYALGINIADPERSSPAYEKRLAKYASRGFAVAVPGLDLERVAPRYMAGTFTYVGETLRRLTLTFGGGDQPTYAVGQREVCGLPKLLVLANMCAIYRESADGHRHATTDQSGDGTFLVDLDKLAEYGGSKDEVWRRATPPACPPRKVGMGTKLTRKELLEGGVDDYTNGSLLLPYGEDIEPNSLVGHLSGHSLNPPLNEDGSVAFVHHLIDLRALPDNGGANPLPLGPIEDANLAFPAAYAGGLEAKLPRYLSFPPSNAMGLANPFARLPADQWFGDVYAPDVE